jgi:nucleoside-diphosphate-sugar epimerase
VKVVVTGGAGFLGTRLAARLLELGALTAPHGGRQAIERIVLADAAEPAFPLADPRVEYARGDVADAAWTGSLVDGDDVSVFHLASIVSGQAEREPALAHRVNIDGGRAIVAAASGRARPLRLVATSTLAVFGGELPALVGDGTKQTPQTTYGMTKAFLELLINDASRRGELDGRVGRLATVIVRPGAPNAAASSMASSIVREPLAGRDYEVPAAPETALAVVGVRTVIEGLVALHEAPPETLGLDRAVTFPSLPVTLGQLADALRETCGDQELGAISWAPDPEIERIVSTWPVGVECARASALGVPGADPLERIIRDARTA